MNDQLSSPSPLTTRLKLGLVLNGLIIFAEFVGAGLALIAVTVRNMLGTLAYTG